MKYRTLKEKLIIVINISRSKYKRRVTSRNGINISTYHKLGKKIRRAWFRLLFSFAQLEI